MMPETECDAKTKNDRNKTIAKSLRFFHALKQPAPNEKFQIGAKSRHCPSRSHVEWRRAHVEWRRAHVEWRCAHVEWRCAHVEWQRAHVEWRRAHVEWLVHHVE